MFFEGTEKKTSVLLWLVFRNMRSDISYLERVPKERARQTSTLYCLQPIILSYCKLMIFSKFSVCKTLYCYMEVYVKIVYVYQLTYHCTVYILLSYTVTLWGRFKYYKGESDVRDIFG